jgi:hypothetical protein
MSSPLFRKTPFPAPPRAVKLLESIAPGDSVLCAPRFDTPSISGPYVKQVRWKASPCPEEGGKPSRPRPPCWKTGWLLDGDGSGGTAADVVQGGSARPFLLELTQVAANHLERVLLAFDLPARPHPRPPQQGNSWLRPAQAVIEEKPKGAGGEQTPFLVRDEG